MALHDQITVHIRNLEAHKITTDQYGILLIPIVMVKLPEEIRIAQEIESEVWNINDLMKVVLSEVKARETSENTKLKSARSSGNGRCSHGGHHYTAGPNPI